MSHRFILRGIGQYGFKANMTAHNCLKLLFPVAMKCEIISKRPIGAASSRHQRDGNINIAFWPRVPRGATSEKPKLPNTAVRASPRAQASQPLVLHIHHDFFRLSTETTAISHFLQRGLFQIWIDARVCQKPKCGVAPLLGSQGLLGALSWFQKHLMWAVVSLPYGDVFLSASGRSVWIFKCGVNDLAPLLARY